jgi:hypothetical protein
MRPAWGGHTAALWRRVAPSGARAQADHAQPALTAVRTALTGLEKGRLAGGRLTLAVWGRTGCGRFVARQAALELVQERTMDGTPEPSIADCVAPLGPHMRQTAPDALVGGQGHGLPALRLGVPGAEAAVAVLDGEQTAIRQRDPVDRPAPVMQDRLRAVDGGLAGDDPPRGPDRLGDGQVRPWLTHQRPQPPTNARREGMDGDQGGCASWLSRAPVGGDRTIRYEAVPMGMVGQGTGPGVPHTQAPDEPADIRRVHGTLHERLGCGTAEAIVEGLRMTPDHLPPLLGRGEDHVNVGDR